MKGKQCFKTSNKQLGKTLKGANFKCKFREDLWHIIWIIHANIETQGVFKQCHQHSKHHHSGFSLVRCYLDRLSQETGQSVITLPGVSLLLLLFFFPYSIIIFKILLIIFSPSPVYQVKCFQRENTKLINCDQSVFPSSVPPLLPFISCYRSFFLPQKRPYIY